MSSIAKDLKPVSYIRLPEPFNNAVQNTKTPSFATRTEAQLYDQGITYNEPGLTYNEIGIAYGGVYGAQDKREIRNYAVLPTPINNKIYDIPGQIVPPAGDSGMLIGILGLTYP